MNIYPSGWTDPEEISARHVTTDQPGAYASHDRAMCTPDGCGLGIDELPEGATAEPWTDDDTAELAAAMGQAAHARRERWSEALYAGRLLRLYATDRRYAHWPADRRLRMAVDMARSEVATTRDYAGAEHDATCYLPGGHRDPNRQSSAHGRPGLAPSPPRPDDVTRRHDRVPEPAAMTAHDLSRARIELERATHRAERANWYGDHAGALIAASQAAALRRRIVAAMSQRAIGALACYLEREGVSSARIVSVTTDTLGRYAYAECSAGDGSSWYIATDRDAGAYGWSGTAADALAQVSAKLKARADELARRG